MTRKQKRFKNCCFFVQRSIYAEIRVHRDGSRISEKGVYVYIGVGGSLC